MSMRHRFFLFAAFTALSASSATAETINHAEEYKACMELVRNLPGEAFEAGLAWRSLGGGEAAEHCISSALIGMKSYKTGAERMEKLAQESRRSKEFKAQILAQAAQGWFLGEDYARARAVISAAIALDPNQSDFFVDRAQMLGAENAIEQAIADLDQAVILNDTNVDALVFRGSLYRLKEEFDKAWADVARALALEPGHAEGLLERGMLYRIDGKTEEARRDWLDAIAQDEHGDTARTARLNLEKMDVVQDAAQ